MPSLVEIGPVVKEKKMKMWKVYRQTDGRTDRQTTNDKWSEKLTWVFSSGELKKLKHEINVNLSLNNHTETKILGISLYFFYIRHTNTFLLVSIASNKRRFIITQSLILCCTSCIHIPVTVYFFFNGFILKDNSKRFFLKIIRIILDQSAHT